MTWKVLPRNVWNDIVSCRAKRLNNSTKYLLHASMTIISKNKNWNPWENCQKCAFKLFWHAYAWHVLDDPIFYGQWTNLHDRSQNGPSLVMNDYLVCSVTFITHVITKQYCHVRNTAEQCRLGLFQDSDFAGDLEDSKSTSGGALCIFGSHTFVPISWMCKKQTLVSQSSTVTEIISCDAGLRMDGIPVLHLWDLIVAVLHGNIYQSNQERWDPHKFPTRKKLHGKIDDLHKVDFVSEALLYFFEDNEAVIMMIIKRRSPTMRHVSRTHRVALDVLFDSINLDPKIQIKYIDTNNQLAEI